MWCFWIGCFGFPKKGARVRKPAEAMSQRSIVRLTGLSWKSAVLIATKASPQMTPKMTTRLLVKIRLSLRDLCSIFVSSLFSRVIE